MCFQHEKGPRLREGLFFGGGSGGGAVGPKLKLSGLLRLLLLVRAGCWGRRVAGELLQIVLQQADLNASAAHVLGLGVLIGGGNWGVTHAYEVDPVDRNLMVKYQVTHDRLSHLLRV